MTACSPNPQRLACSGQGGIPAANWPTCLLWKSRKAVQSHIVRTGCCSVAIARVVLSSLFLLLADSSVNGVTPFFLFSLLMETVCCRCCHCIGDGRASFLFDKVSSHSGIMSRFSRITYTLRELLENMFLALTTAAATACFTQNDLGDKLT